MLIGSIFLLFGLLIFSFAFLFLVGGNYNYRMVWSDIFNRYVYRKFPAQETSKAWVMIIISAIMIYIGYMLEGLSYINFE